MDTLRSRYGSPPPVGELRDLHGGRLLVYFPDMELSDGAAEAESLGFLDVNNAPPWDSWVAFIQYPDDRDSSYLIAWIPPEFVRLVDAGIRVNTEECVKWVEDSGVDLRKLITC